MSLAEVVAHFQEENLQILGAERGRLARNGKAGGTPALRGTAHGARCGEVITKARKYEDAKGQAGDSTFSGTSGIREFGDAILALAR
jgi:hypothetical protein